MRIGEEEGSTLRLYRETLAACQQTGPSAFTGPRQHHGPPCSGPAPRKRCRGSPPSTRRPAAARARVPIRVAPLQSNSFQTQMHIPPLLGCAQGAYWLVLMAAGSMGRSAKRGLPDICRALRRAVSRAAGWRPARARRPCAPPPPTSPAGCGRRAPAGVAVTWRIEANGKSSCDRETGCSHVLPC